MAKSKKQEGTEKQAAATAKSQPAKKTATRKSEDTAKATSPGPAKKAPTRKAPKARSATPLNPLVDTSLAAAAAARMVANRDRLSGTESRGGSGLIKHLKDSL